jgi:hypothetical protein
MDDSMMDTSIYDVEGSSDFEVEVKPVRQQQALSDTILG